MQLLFTACKPETVGIESLELKAEDTDNSDDNETNQGVADSSVKFELNFSTTAGGKIYINDKLCEEDTCLKSFSSDSLLKLSFVPEEGFEFKRFTGDCVGAQVCSLKMDANKNVQAVFSRIIVQSSPPAKLVAFPGAEGFGAETIGGRGGRVVKVTNLNDSGPGSFREAVEAPARNRLNGSYKYESDDAYKARLEAAGKRIVVFDVSGIINLESPLIISYPFLTIAGETSPGGILVTGHETDLNAHDVIMRFMRFRMGSHRVKYDTTADGDIIYYDSPQYSFPPSGGSCRGNITTKEAGGMPCAIAGGADPEKLDAFDIRGSHWNENEAYNIIIDHCSFSWGVDETMTITGGAMNTTLQWSIVSEGLDYAGHPKGIHGKGLMVSGKYVQPSSISLLRNYIAHNTARSPLLSSPEDVSTVVDAINNVSYNWNGGSAPQVNGSAKVNWVHNYSKPGLNSHAYSFEVTLGEDLYDSTKIFVQGNIGSTRESQELPEWNVGFSWRNQMMGENTYRILTPYAAPQTSTHPMTADTANCIVSASGATAPVRDSVDTRVINDFINGTGRIIDDVHSLSEFPQFENLPAPSDTDNDGMADYWEVGRGLNTDVNDSALDHDNDGYTNIEEYLHDLAARSITFDSRCMTEDMKL